MHLFESVILSVKTQFLIPNDDDDDSNYDSVEKDAILVQKLLVVIGLIVIDGRFLMHLF